MTNLLRAAPAIVGAVDGSSHRHQRVRVDWSTELPDGRDLPVFRTTGD